MPTTQEIADENTLLIDGASSNDPVVPKRWKRTIQQAANIVWNDRPWKFKLKTNAAFSFNPASLPVTLPTDFGSFESAGAGVYAQNNQAWLQPMDIGEYNILVNGTNVQTMPVGPYTRYSMMPNPTTGAPGLVLWPLVPATTQITLVYLRRAPRCYLTADGTSDELFWIPSQWHDIIIQGSVWLNAKGLNANSEEIEKEFTKLGLDQMRDRETWGGQGINRVVGFRPSRRCR